MNNLRDRTETILKGELDNSQGASRYDTEDIYESLRLIDDLKYFLATAPANWQENQIIRRYYLNNEHGFVSCVFWNNVYYVTGTDIVKCCLYRMQKFGRTIIQKKKFEEGIFSDLRNLKCGIDATLEQPRSEFLGFLYRNSCLKTQKKQKVFFWFSVPYDKLFADALERDLKRENSNHQATTKAVCEPAISFLYDSKSSKKLYDQLLAHSENNRFKTNEMDEKSSANPEVLEQTTVASEQLVTPPDLGNMQPLVTIDPSESSNTLISQESQTSLDHSNTINTTETVLEVPTPEFEFSLNNGELKPMKSAKLENHVKEEQNSFKDISLDYFPIDIEYPEELPALEQANDLGPLISSMPEFGTNLNSQDQGRKANHSSNYNNLIGGGNEFLNADIFDSTQQRSNFYKQQQQQQTYNPYVNMVVPPLSAYPSEIIPQSIDQPLVGFENVFTPQNVMTDYFQQPHQIQQSEMVDWNVLLQHPVQTLPSAHSLNPYTPGYRSSLPNVWVQSPYATNNQNLYRQQKTPKVTKRRQFHNMTPATSKSAYPRPNRVAKQTVYKNSDGLREKRSRYQHQLRTNSKQQTPVIQNQGIDRDKIK